MLETGDQAPNFELPDQNGNLLSLGDLRGRWIAMWWYPKASSETCSVQGDGFCAIQRDFKDLDIELIGVSFDSIEANHNFASSGGFDFPLLSDADRSVGTQYEVTRDPSDPHAPYPLRISYIIDPDGRIARAYLVEEAQAEAQADSRLLLSEARSLLEANGA